MIRISFPPGAQQDRDMCLVAVVGKCEGGDVGTVGEEGLLFFVSPWGGTSMPWSANAVTARPTVKELSYFVPHSV